MGMKRTSPTAFGLPLLFLPLALLPSCASTAADLAANDSIYVDLEYACKLPGDRTVFVAPLADARPASVEAAVRIGDYPMLYDGDARWERPVVAMVDDVLHREVVASGIFVGVVDQAAQADVVILPSLVTFATAAIEQESGGQSLAEAALRLQVFGPIGADGQRAPLLDQVFGDRQVTEVGFRTASRHLLAGVATRFAMLRLLQGLDSSNVGRNGMPIVTPPKVPTAAASAVPTK